MKNILLQFTTLLTLAVSCAQQTDYSMYLTAEEVPNAVYWLPAPPAPGLTQFEYDLSPTVSF